MATCAIAFHLAAVFIAPFAIPPSDLSLRLRAWFRPYIEINHLDHGYKFFDEPGPSFRMRYRIEVAEGGGAPIEGEFPDRDVHWPRLLYHRHLMLADHNQRVFRLPQDAPPADQRNSQIDAIWAADKHLSDVYMRSHCEHLLHKYADRGARRVTLFGLIRAIPTSADVKAGRFPGPVESRELITYPPPEKK